MTSNNTRKKKKKKGRAGQIVSTDGKIHTLICYDHKSRSTVCFHYLSEWPEVRYDMPVPVPGEALRNCAHKRQNITVTVTPVCVRTHTHARMRESRQRADSGKQLCRQERGTQVIWLGLKAGYVSAPKVPIGLFDSCIAL